MAKKVLVVFNEEEMLFLKRIYYDEDPAEALEFVLKHIFPQVEREISCLTGLDNLHTKFK